MSPVKSAQCYPNQQYAAPNFKNQVRSKEPSMSLNDLEFAYAPVRDQVRDLREYL
jgi:hypothetical protein